MVADSNEGVSVCSMTHVLFSPWLILWSVVFPFLINGDVTMLAAVGTLFGEFSINCEFYAEVFCWFFSAGSLVTCSLGRRLALIVQAIRFPLC